ncbi:unnamed protein product [Rhizophagus irregularis]|nr:unnamed protein product [Rhizophagus irregularis]CAB5386513.1 unnamed protein product [Rhizophagus irregularis]
MSLEDNYVFVNGKSAPFADAYLTQSKDIIRFGFDFISIQKINYECKKNNDAVNDAKQKKMKVLNDFCVITIISHHNNLMKWILIIYQTDNCLLCQKGQIRTGKMLLYGGGVGACV